MCKKRDENCNTPSQVSQNEIGPHTAEERLNAAYEIRRKCAEFQKNLPLPNHLSNADEITYPKKIGNYSKCLPHNSLGEVNLDAYHSLIQASTTGNPALFEKIKLGAFPNVKLKNPQAAFTFDLAGPDSHHLKIEPAPSVSSAWAASDIAEVYWEALLRDIPFLYFNDENATEEIKEAADDLSRFCDYRGPTVDNKVTPNTLFRGIPYGNNAGPWLSQFLWKEFTTGSQTTHQKVNCPARGIDYLTNYNDWLKNQNGSPPPKPMQIDPTPRYISCGRDLAEWVHNDVPFQAVFNACAILKSYGDAALDPSNPYLQSKTQYPFVTFGPPHIFDFVVRAARLALEAAWYQKWLVHRRLRPEEFGGLIHNMKTGQAKYPLHPDILDSKAIEKVYDKYGTYLLPQAFAEGCPSHSSYPSGHATFIGAGVTMLKAFFNEDFIIPDPVQANVEGSELIPYPGEPLTVLGELNKLAYNIGNGRNIGGVHYRTDATEGNKLGEAAAIGILQDYNNTYNEPFTGFTITKFDGTTVTI